MKLVTGRKEASVKIETQQRKTPMPPSGFEWNEEKAQLSLRKHGVAFTEAMTVFDDPNCLVMDDKEHSIGEARFLILGCSIAYRLLLVVHCDGEAFQGNRNENIRIISARPATASERHTYQARL